MVFESTVLLRRRPLCSSPRLRRRCLPEADLLGHLRHVLPADQAGADAGELALAPLGMRDKQRLGNHQPQHGVAEELEALVVGRRGLFALIGLRELVGQRAVGERAHQQLRVREPMTRVRLQAL